MVDKRSERTVFEQRIFKCSERKRDRDSCAGTIQALKMHQLMNVWEIIGETENKSMCEHMIIRIAVNGANNFVSRSTHC